MQGGDLVDAAALLALFDQFLGLRHTDGTALARAVEHVAHMAHEDAQAFVQVAAALAHHAADTAALAGRHAQVALVVLNVLAALLIVDGDGVGGNGAFNGDDAHDARAHRGIRRVLDLAGGGVLMESVSNLGMLETELLVDEQELKDAGGVGRQQIDLQVDLRHDDLHDEADIRQLMQDLSRPLDRHLRLARDDGHEARLHAGQRQHHGDLLVGDPLLKHLVFGAVGRDFVMPVVDLLAELDQILSHLHIFPPSRPKSHIFG